MSPLLVCIFAVYYWVLARYRSAGKDSLWLLPALMVLWVNLHGAWIVGLATLAVWIVGDAWQRRSVRC